MLLLSHFGLIVTLTHMLLKWLHNISSLLSSDVNMTLLEKITYNQL
jgi:hypothetical protein